MLQFDPDIILLWAGPHITGTSAFSKVVNMSIHAADFTFVIMISPRAPTKPSTRKPTRLTMMRQHRARLPQSLHTRAHPLPSVVLVSVCMHPCDLSKGPRALSAGDALPAFLLLLSFAASRQISARISGAHRFNLFKLRYYTSDRLPSLHRTVVCRLKKETIRGPRVPSI